MDKQNISDLYNLVMRLMIVQYGLPNGIKQSEESKQFLKKCMILSMLITEEKLQNPELEVYN